MEDFVAFAGYSAIIASKYTFVDTESIKRTKVGDAFDFCGEKILKFYINNTDFPFFKATNKDHFILSPPNDYTNFGTVKAEVVAVMKNYPSVKSMPISFTVTILGSLVPRLENKLYTLSTAPLTITIEAFQVIPNDYDVGPYSIDAYIFKGFGLPAYIDLGCNCLTRINDLDWISFE